jgi:hypothetical protein
VSRARLNIFIEPSHAKRLAELAAMKGLSKSAVIGAALSSFLAPESGDEQRAMVGRRLDQLSRQFSRLERDQSILIETVALFVRYYLTVSTPVPEAHQAAARAQGKARFSKFVEQLARHVRRGPSLGTALNEAGDPGFDGASDVGSASVAVDEVVP